MLTFVSTIFILIYSTDAAKEGRDKSLTNIQYHKKLVIVIYVNKNNEHILNTLYDCDIKT